jgi:DNA repair protein RadC
MSTLKSLLIRDQQLGVVRNATADEIIDAARSYVAHKVRRGASLASPTAARDYLVLRFAELQHEVFCVIYLDSRHRVIECQDLFRGTIDGASVHPREVVKEALRRNAAACVLVHNHPSGVAEPSPADEL